MATGNCDLNQPLINRNDLFMSKLNFVSLVSILLLGTACNAQVSAGAGCAKPPLTGGANVAVVSGVLHKEEHWGPPNFGEKPETDSKFHAFVLELDHPLSVTEDKEFGSGKTSEVKKLQLHIPANQIAFAASNEGRRIKATGTLGVATAPADVIPKNMQASEITAVAEPIVNECRYAK